MSSLGLRFLSDQLDDRHLHQFVHSGDLIEVAKEVPDCGRLGDAAERDEGVPLAR